jgi:fibronectin type 3 domain-containing protein
MQITLDWDDNSEGDILEYIVYSSDAGDGEFSELGRSDVSEYVHADLDNGVEYFYRVSALDKTGNESDPTDIISAVPRDQVPPPAVENFGGTAADRSVQLTWDDALVSDLAEYIVYRSLVSGSGYTEIGRSSINSYLDTSVTNGTTYFYIVTVLDTSGNEGPASEERSFTPDN